MIRGRSQTHIFIPSQVSFGARFLSDDDKEITYNYSSQYNDQLEQEASQRVSQDLKTTIIESTGVYKDGGDENGSFDDARLLMDEDGGVRRVRD